MGSENPRYTLQSGGKPPPLGDEQARALQRGVDPYPYPFTAKRFTFTYTFMINRSRGIVYENEYVYGGVFFDSDPDFDSTLPPFQHSNTRFGF